MQILDPSFTRYRIYSSTVEQAASGMRWAEGPVYFPEGYVLVSDIPNNRIMKYDEKTGVVEWKGTPNRSIWSYDVSADGTSVSNKTKLIDAADQGALDGFRVDRDGNLWCGWGSNGALQPEPTEVNGRKVYQLRGKSEDLDGVMVFNPQGKAIGFIKLPERCANLTFGGPKNNRLYMASCHSLYALYVESHGAT